MSTFSKIVTAAFVASDGATAVSVRSANPFAISEETKQFSHGSGDIIDKHQPFIRFMSKFPAKIFERWHVNPHPREHDRMTADLQNEQCRYFETTHQIKERPQKVNYYQSVGGQVSYHVGPAEGEPVVEFWKVEGGHRNGAAFKQPYFGSGFDVVFERDARNAKFYYCSDDYRAVKYVEPTEGPDYLNDLKNGDLLWVHKKFLHANMRQSTFTNKQFVGTSRCASP